MKTFHNSPYQTLITMHVPNEIERLEIYLKVLPLARKNNQSEIDLLIWQNSPYRLRDIPQLFPELDKVRPANTLPNKDFWPCTPAGNALRKHAIRKMILFVKRPAKVICEKY